MRRYLDYTPPSSPKGLALAEMITALMDDRLVHGHYRNKVMNHMRAGNWRLAIQYANMGGVDKDVIYAAITLME